MNEIIARLQAIKDDVAKFRPNYDHSIGHSRKASGFSSCDKALGHLGQALGCLKNARGELGIEED